MDPAWEDQPGSQGHKDPFDEIGNLTSLTLDILGGSAEVATADAKPQKQQHPLDPLAMLMSEPRVESLDLDLLGGSAAPGKSAMGGGGAASASLLPMEEDIPLDGTPLGGAMQPSVSESRDEGVFPREITGRLASHNELSRRRC